MKKLLLTLIATAIAQSVFSWEIMLGVGEFFADEDAKLVVQEEYKFALIVDTTKNDLGNWNTFENFTLNSGDSFVKGEWTNTQNQSYKTLVTGNLNAEEGYVALGTEEWKNFDNDKYGFEGKENVALVVWNSTDEDVVHAGDKYVLISPKFVDAIAEDELKDWVIPTGINERLQWYLTSKSQGGAAANKYFAIVEEVGSAVPEPSTYASIFGAMALGFALIRRKR